MRRDRKPVAPEGWENCLLGVRLEVVAVHRVLHHHLDGGVIAVVPAVHGVEQVAVLLVPQDAIAELADRGRILVLVEPEEVACEVCIGDKAVPGAHHRVGEASRLRREARDVQATEFAWVGLAGGRGSLPLSLPELRRGLAAHQLGDGRSGIDSMARNEVLHVLMDGGVAGHVQELVVGQHEPGPLPLQATGVK